MTAIYLIRHGEAEGNIYGRCQGQYNSRLTKLGRAQSEALSLRFKDTQIDAIYSSDLARAMQTAEPLARSKNLQIIPMKGLREVAMGECEDIPWAEVPYRFPKEYYLMRHDPEKMCHPGGESMLELTVRMANSLDSIIRDNPDRTVAVFSHGAAIRSYLSTLEYGDLSHQQAIKYTNTAVSLLTAGDAGVKIRFVNDNSHISPENGFEPKLRRKFSQDENALRFIRVSAENIDVFEELVGSSGRYTLCGQLKDSILNGRIVANLAVISDKPVGFLVLDPADDDTGLIKMAWISPEYRHRGLGSHLFGESISFFRHSGKIRLTAAVLPSDNEALDYAARFDIPVEGETLKYEIPDISID